MRWIAARRFSPQHMSTDYLIHGGHSSILARGARSIQAPSPEWRVALRHPLRPDRRLAEIKLCNCAVWVRQDRASSFSIIADVVMAMCSTHAAAARPKGCFPVTVLTPRADEADALATAFFVLGSGCTRAFCTQRPDMKAVFVLPGSRDGTVSSGIDWGRRGTGGAGSLSFSTTAGDCGYPRNHRRGGLNIAVPPAPPRSDNYVWTSNSSREHEPHGSRASRPITVRSR